MPLDPYTRQSLSQEEFDRIYRRKPTPRPILRCSFCGQESEQAGFRHLFVGEKHASGKPVNLCDQCVIKFKRELHERGIK